MENQIVNHSVVYFQNFNAQSFIEETVTRPKMRKLWIVWRPAVSDERPLCWPNEYMNENGVYKELEAKREHSSTRHADDNSLKTDKQFRSGSRRARYCSATSKLTSSIQSDKLSRLVCEYNAWFYIAAKENQVLTSLNHIYQITSKSSYFTWVSKPIAHTPQ